MTPKEQSAFDAMREALEQIALAGMSGTGQESEEAMRDWHARQAWGFIAIAARALAAAKAWQAQPQPTDAHIAELEAKCKDYEAALKHCAKSRDWLNRLKAYEALAKHGGAA